MYIKHLLAVWAVLWSFTAFAQISQREMTNYSAERVMKYRNKLGLEPGQVDFIKKVYNTNSAEFNNLKWDLDETNLQLSELLDHPKIDSEAAMQLMEKVMALESEIKIKRLSVYLRKNQLTPEQQELLSDGSPSDDMVLVDGSVALKVRKSKGSKEEPLYVIVEGSETRIVEKPKQFDPNDIESVQVLKGASAETLYGSKAKNGVVIIKLDKKRKKK